MTGTIWFTNPKMFTICPCTEFSDPCDAADAKSLQSCPTLCDPRGSSPPGSSVRGILQARILEWVAISFSKVVVIDDVYT